ncbi:unnamed protein product [Boreogadus saida]
MSSQISSEPVGFRNEREQSSRTEAYRAETIERTRHYHREAQRASVSQGTPETLDPERHVDPASPRARRSTACNWPNQWLVGDLVVTLTEFPDQEVPALRALIENPLSSTELIKGVIRPAQNRDLLTQHTPTLTPPTLTPPILTHISPILTHISPILTHISPS